MGAPITEEEVKAGLALEITAPDSDPISTSGYFQGDIMVQSRDHLTQILEVRQLGKERERKEKMEKTS